MGRVGVGMTWRTEAKGLPVWEGALFYDGDDEFTQVCAGVDDNRVIAGGDSWDSQPSRCTPALDNPDTFAAFLRRLAIRLGCPEEMAGEGVIAAVDEVFVPASRRSDGKDYRVTRLYIVAGFVKSKDYIDADVEWRWNADVGTPDPLLAAVRAWKGVGGG